MFDFKRFIRNIVLILATLAFIYYAQKSMDSYSLSILMNIGIFAILALSYNLINGVAGQFSLEPNGFVAIGAYFTAILIIPPETKLDMFALVDPAPIVASAHMSFLPAVLIGGFAAMLVAMLLALPVFRVRGDYLAIVTLGFGFIIRIFAINNPEYTNGAMGLNDIPEYANFIWIGTIALITFIVMIHILYSKYGRSMKAVRDDEDAATAMGINTFKIKTLAFMTSAFFEGVGGGLLASMLTTITPDQFSFLLTFQLLIFIVLGGLGSMSGALFASILLGWGLEKLRILDENITLFGHDFGAHPGLRMVVFSIILLLMMLYARRGVFGDRELTDIIRDYKRKKLESKK